MIVIFKKAFTLNGKKRFVGSITRLTDTKARELLNINVAEPYKGPMPPIKKIRTEFFKPHTHTHGSNHGSNKRQ